MTCPDCGAEFHGRGCLQCGLTMDDHDDWRDDETFFASDDSPLGPWQPEVD